jgi:hypothetical protein
MRLLDLGYHFHYQMELFMDLVNKLILIGDMGSLRSDQKQLNWSNHQFQKEAQVGFILFFGVNLIKPSYKII